MADECDMAQDLQALYLRTALEHRPRERRDVSLQYCEECDAPIPEARRRAVLGASLCLACQEEADAGYR